MSGHPGKGGVEDVAAWVAEARRIVALTGAGISTESGIPDFRGPEGLWTKDPAAERRATIEHYVSDRQARVAGWRNRAEGRSGYRAEPNPGHFALTALDGLGKLHTLVTQNVDGLHHAAGTNPARIIEIHGTVRDYRCLGCGDRGPIEIVLERVRAGNEDPHCDCGGLLKTATISFGQALVVEDLERAQGAAAVSDLFLAVGTSLGVYPAAGLPQIALQSGARLAIINAEPTPYDEVASAVLRGQISEVLPRIAGLIGG